MKRITATFIAAAAATFAAFQSLAHGDHGAKSNSSTANWAPNRTKPVKEGEFRVDFIMIAFPDCKQPPEDLEKVKQQLISIGGSGDFASAEMTLKGSGSAGEFTVTDYYKIYSQGLTWPVFAIYPHVYTAPHPLGYYCRHDKFSNPIGYHSDGGARAAKLREDALKYVKSKGGLPPGGSFNCWVYCTTLDWSSPTQGAEPLLRPHYPKPSDEARARGVPDKIRDYKPPIRWADPLWPNSVIQVHYPGNGGVMVHELGHCLGAPDFYHATEEHDGLPGSPSLGWAYGPTGPAYCRWKYQAFVPPEAYPIVKKSGRYTLGKRSGFFPFQETKGRKAASSDPPTGEDHLPLGLYIPSTHPNYMIYLEYCHDEKGPVGRPGHEGLLVHAINVTMSSPSLGPPDLCYVYRRDDPYLRAIGGGSPFLHTGDTFTTNSNPAAILPNRLPAGVEITNIVENTDGSCTLDIVVNPPKLTKQQLDFSLLPQTVLTAVDEILPTSFRAELDMIYRGEPLNTEYGFCVGQRKDPDVKRDLVFPLHHRDRYEARIIDLVPGKAYYIRAYAKNESGVRYSENQKAVIMPEPYRFANRETPNLFLKSDRLLDTWYVKQYHFGTSGDYYKNANAIIALLALANYYRAVPGEDGSKSSSSLATPVSRKKKGGDGIDMQNVHCNPSASRPRFRMGDVEKLISRMTSLAQSSWLSRPNFNPPEEKPQGKKKTPRPAPLISRKSAFGDHEAWIKHCAEALKIKKPEQAFRVCETHEQFAALIPEIKTWILQSQPVMIVRQSEFIGTETHYRHPLDTVLIDGYDGDRLHAVFPLGHDRSKSSRKDSYLDPEEFFDDVRSAVVIFYRPGGIPSRQTKITWPPQKPKTPPRKPVIQRGR